MSRKRYANDIEAESIVRAVEAVGHALTKVRATNDTAMSALSSLFSNAVQQKYDLTDEEEETFYEAHTDITQKLLDVMIPLIYAKRKLPNDG